MAQQAPDRAIIALEPSLPYELGGPPPGINGTMYPAYIRGLAYLAQKNGPAAAAEFQKFLDHPGIVQNFLLGSLAHLQLGRAYAISGDTAKAKAAYQDFLDALERRRPRHPHPERSQGGVREVAVARLLVLSLPVWRAHSCPRASRGMTQFFLRMSDCTRSSRGRPPL